MKIICVGQNYAAHAAELGDEPPAEPLIFGKFDNTPGVGFAREPKLSLAAGDIVEVEVEGIGTCANPAAAER